MFLRNPLLPRGAQMFSNPDNVDYFLVSNVHLSSISGLDTPSFFQWPQRISKLSARGKVLGYQRPILCMRDVDVDEFPLYFCRKVFFVAQTQTEYVCVCWPHNHLFRSVLPCNQTGIRKGTSCLYIQENTFHCSSKVCVHKYSSEKKSVI